jgi:peptide-methionine (S)-S-oxide reductase
MKSLLALILACALAVLAFGRGGLAQSPAPAAAQPAAKLATAIFAGGCFWCLEADFEKLRGVASVESGYAGGNVPNPTYERVSAGGTGHAEVVRVHYDPAQVKYEQLLDYFWRHIDPTVENRQFCDVGDQYRSAIFYQSEAERIAALASKAALERSGRFARIHTQIAPAGRFYVAEEYHQDYYKKNPIRYAYYRNGCGRDARVKEVWGDKP